MAGLDEAVSAYQAARNVLCDPKSDDTSARVMAALLSRDRLAQVLADSAQITPDLLDGISALDRSLKNSAPAIDGAVGRATLAGWREVVQPPASAWWWYLDQAAQAAEPRPHPLWAVSAGVCLTLAAALFIDTSQKLLSAGTNFVGVFGTLLQGLVTLAAASTLLSSGQQGLRRVLVRLGVARRFHHRWKTGLAFAVMLAMLGVSLTLPAMAAYYTARYIADRALTAYATGHLYQAIDDLRRAASLDPGNVQAHYNLAVVFEEAGQYDKAEPEYQSAMALDGKFYPAYNNLARLYIRLGLARRDAGRSNPGVV
jgi:tetratricopeptide (TPR) repeat protein